SCVVPRPPGADAPGSPCLPPRVAHLPAPPPRGSPALAVEHEAGPPRRPRLAPLVLAPAGQVLGLLLEPARLQLRLGHAPLGQLRPQLGHAPAHLVRVAQHCQLRLAQGLQLAQLLLAPQPGVELLHEDVGGGVVDRPQADGGGPGPGVLEAALQPQHALAILAAAQPGLAGGPHRQAAGPASRQPRRSSRLPSSALRPPWSGSALAPASTSPEASSGLRAKVYSERSAANASAPRSPRRPGGAGRGGSKKPWVARCS